MMHMVDKVLRALILRDFNRQDKPAIGDIELGRGFQRVFGLVAARLGPATVMCDEVIDLRHDFIFQLPQGKLHV